jgi:hypothetical protein
MTFNGGEVFSLLSFALNGQEGQAPALYMSKTFGGFDQLVSENLHGIETSLTGPLTRFSIVTELFLDGGQWLGAGG